MSAIHWMQAFSRTDDHITRIAGFATILREVTMEWAPLNNPDPVANGVLSLIRAIDDDLRKLEDMRTEEWRLRRDANAPVASG
ncbi:hypothetical protein [Paracoccus tibetensis]|uniref:Uncharacterized protein n=1 Tax=Paracoccus tibetensis TaxID=336292 RepID=A0A1G5JY61_9RHOB|nr:hypothetical protein [Paracoccus tibetensis]SCY93104.1 hypothetical protein SAMN05660710_03518 [Paracoccus tibetensis]